MRHELITEGHAKLERCLAAFSDAPRAGALLCDIDGTISPIVGRPGDAAVPERFRRVLAALVERIGLVAFVTGRALEDGRRMIALPGAAYVGTHGLEIVGGDGRVLTEPQAERYVEEIRAVAESARRDLDCAALGVVLEDKRVVLAIHYRLAPDPAAARREILASVVAPAQRRGLAISTGHFVYEIRPPLPVTKGTATLRLLGADSYGTALFCGDDLTDVTGFTAIHDWGRRDTRRTACALAAMTAETPAAVAEEADVLVRSTDGVHEALTRLLAAVS